MNRMTKGACFHGLLIKMLLLVAAQAEAAPQTRVSATSSSVYIFATNNEERSYQCSIRFSWSHSRFGERKSDTVNSTTHVQAKLNDGLIYRLEGAYVDLRIDGDVDISCS